jgi:peroxiredoxin
VLLGCSVDSADAHRAFIKKYSLPFPLLLDPDKKIATEYGVANGIAKYGSMGVSPSLNPKINQAARWSVTRS